MTLLPDYSVVGDPMERAGLITTRPIAGDHTGVTLVLQQRAGGHVPRAVRDLHEAFLSAAAHVRRVHRGDRYRLRS